MMLAASSITAQLHVLGVGSYTELEAAPTQQFWGSDSHRLIHDHANNAIDADAHNVPPHRVPRGPLCYADLTPLPSSWQRQPLRDALIPDGIAHATAALGALAAHEASVAKTLTFTPTPTSPKPNTNPNPNPGRARGRPLVTHSVTTRRQRARALHRRRRAICRATARTASASAARRPRRRHRSWSLARGRAHHSLARWPRRAHREYEHLAACEGSCSTPRARQPAA